MGRVLRIGAGLMGVLLVVMTAGLWFRRATTEPEYGMLFVHNNDDGSSAVLMREPELNYARQISPTFVDMKGFWRTSSSRATGLVLGRKSEEKMSTIYRLRLDPFGLHKIDTIPTEDNQQTSFAPNNQWVAYEGNGSCFLRNLESGETRNLADLLPEGTYLHCTRFSDDSRWASVLADFGDGYTSVMIRVSDNYAVRLDDDRFEGVYPTAWSLDEQWLIGTRNSYIYRSNPNEIQWQPVLNTSPAGLTTTIRLELLQDWLPEEALLIIQVIFGSDYQQVVAVPLAGGPPRWIAHNVKYAIRNHEWLFFIGRSGEIYRMHVDGAGFLQIADVPADYGAEGLTLIEDANGIEWLYVGTMHDKRFVTKIWRVRVDGSHFEAVVENDYFTGIGDYSPDRKWLLLRTFEDWNATWDIYQRVRLDGSNKQFVLADPHSYFFDWSLSPTKPSQPVLLLIIGIGLIGISIFGQHPYHLIRQRRRPAA